MPYLIRTTYRSGQDELRDRLLVPHVEYLDRFVDRLLAAGGVVSDDGLGVYAAQYILDTEDRAIAQAFVDNEPFVLGGLIAEITIERWRKSYFGGRRLLGDPMRTSSAAVRQLGPVPQAGDDSAR